MDVEVVIFGGGAAGLWLLDELRRRGCCAVLLEANALGTGQTVAAQGIIHGGLKYTLQGLLTKSAASIRDMPTIWRACLDGQSEPNLSNVRRRSDDCFLWRTESLTSRLGMLGAQFGLRIAPQTVSLEERPTILRDCPGIVSRLPEQVISTVSLVEVFRERNRDRLFQIDPKEIVFEINEPGEVRRIQMRGVTLRPRSVVFTAGAGNSNLRREVGLIDDAMQRRPLHMVLVRGALPLFQGHCVDGAKTRVTITADTDSAGRTVWQVGGQIAEEGVACDQPTLLTKARTELLSVLPGIDLSQVEWNTYRVDRAESRMPHGKRPETIQIRREGNCLTAWPTKLALVPQLVAELCGELESRAMPPNSVSITALLQRLNGWSVPPVAQPPWEVAGEWISDQDLAHNQEIVSLGVSRQAA